MRGEHVVGSKRKPNAMPSGGGGGAWKDLNKSMAASRAKLRAIGTQEWVQDKIARGDIEGGMAGQHTGTSIFDPVLCEIAYRWFCPAGGTVLDPFAGGSVRGIVASRLGLKYVGVELRAEQVAANKTQTKLATGPAPSWRAGDSRDIAKLCKGTEADLILSCPPYWNLEVYSDDPRDISTFGREEFFAAQAAIIKSAVAMLKDDRFVVWVTSDVRDADGYYVNLPGKTIDAFEAAGCRLYNDAVLVTAVGSLPVRVNKQFVSGRKLGRTHQYVQVFVKGDWKKAVAALPAPEFGAIEGEAPPSGAKAPAVIEGNQWGELL